jgi:hypothetical protein
VIRAASLRRVDRPELSLLSALGRIKPLIAFLAVGAAAAPILYTYMFFGFRPYDDEGYMLVTLKDYLSGRPLVTPYLQLYGPFYYEVVGAVYRVLGLVPGHDNGRFVTLAIWLVTGVLGGVASYRLTQNIWLGVGAQVGTLSVLTPLSAEPMTVYDLIAVLLIGLVVAATFRSTHPRASAAAMGGMVAALCLIKINVGVFAAIPLVVAWVAGLPSSWRRLAGVPAVGLALLAPFALMAARLNLEWVLEFAAVVCVSVAGIAFVYARSGLRAVPPPGGRWLAAGAAVVMTLVVLIAMLVGTHIADIWNGLVVVPFHFPGVFVVPLPIDAGVAAWAGLSLVAAILFTRQRRWAGPAQSGLVRFCAGVLIWLLVLRQPSSFFLLALPLTWLAALPTGYKPDDDRPGAYCRLFVPALAVASALQAYPVAGTQLGLAALGLVPVGAMILSDGIRELGLAGRPLSRWVAPGALAANVLIFGLLGVASAQQFRAGVPLNLPGSQQLRLPASQAAQLRPLVAAVNTECSSFITYPGMDSLYVWTAQHPPSDMRYGLWWLSLDDAQQKAIVDQVSGKPRLCVVENQSVNEFWAQGRQIPRRPLVDFIDQDFVVAGTYGDYELLVRAG